MHVVFGLMALGRWAYCWGPPGTGGRAALFFFIYLRPSCWIRQLPQPLLLHCRRWRFLLIWCRPTRSSLDAGSQGAGGPATVPQSGCCYGLSWGWCASPAWPSSRLAQPCPAYVPRPRRFAPARPLFDNQLWVAYAPSSWFGAFYDHDSVFWVPGAPGTGPTYGGGRFHVLLAVLFQLACSTSMLVSALLFSRHRSMRGAGSHPPPAGLVTIVPSDPTYAAVSAVPRWRRMGNGCCWCGCWCLALHAVSGPAVLDWWGLHFSWC
jgi:hypothetical protein